MVSRKIGSRILSGFGLLLSTSLLAACAASWQTTPGTPPNAATNGGQTDRVVPVAFPNCSTRVLRVDLHGVEVDSSDSRLASIRDVFTRHPELSYEALETDTGAPAFLVSVSETCNDEACAEEQGWVQIQEELATVSGVQLKCDHQIEAPAPSEPEHQQEQRESRKDDAAKQDHGVGVGN